MATKQNVTVFWNATRSPLDKTIKINPHTVVKEKGLSICKDVYDVCRCAFTSWTCQYPIPIPKSVTNVDREINGDPNVLLHVTKV